MKALSAGILNFLKEKPAQPEKEKKADADIVQITHKLMSTIVWEVNFEDKLLSEAITEIARTSRELDPKKEGVSIVFKAAPGVEEPKVSELRLRNVPLKTVLDYLSSTTNTRMLIQPQGVVFDANPPEEAKKGDYDILRIKNKLKNIIIPEVDFRDELLSEAITELVGESRKLDPKKEGVSIVFREAPGVVAPKVSDLRLRNVPLKVVLEYLAVTTKTRMWIQPQGVVFELTQD